MQNELMDLGVKVSAGVSCGTDMCESVPIARAIYKLEAFDAEGTSLWEEEFSNLVTTVGKTDVLQQYFKGATYTAAWYVGLKGAGSAVVGDTMSSHGAWSEVTAYTEGVRQTLTLGTPSGGSVDNTANKATFSINTNGTGISGCFLVNNSTKGGTTGTLYSAGDFAAARTLASGDSIQVTVTLTAA